MMLSLTDVSCIATIFVKLRGFAFNVTKHVANEIKYVLCMYMYFKFLKNKLKSGCFGEIL
jgi:hypothetical protein